MSWSGFKKNVGRATTQVMMKTGHVEKTSDREYEVEERRYRTLESASLRLQKEAKGYLDSLRAMTASQMRIAETIDAFYGESGASDGVSRSYKQAVEDLDAETIKALDGPYRYVDDDLARNYLYDESTGLIDMIEYGKIEAQMNSGGALRRWRVERTLSEEEKLESSKLMDMIYRQTVLEPINRFCAYFPDINECIKKRNHKMLDYDAMRSKVKRLTEKPDKDPGKLPRTEKETEMVSAAEFLRESVLFPNDMDMDLDLTMPSPPKILDNLKSRARSRFRGARNDSTDSLAPLLRTDGEESIAARTSYDRQSTDLDGVHLRRSSSILSVIRRLPRPDRSPGSPETQRSASSPPLRKSSQRLPSLSTLESPEQAVFQRRTSKGQVRTGEEPGSPHTQYAWAVSMPETPSRSQTLPRQKRVAALLNEDAPPPVPPKSPKRDRMDTGDRSAAGFAPFLPLPKHPRFSFTVPSLRTSLNPSDLEDMMAPLREEYVQNYADKLLQAKAAYEQLNEQLTSELPQLIDLRVPYLDPTFEALVKIQLRFCAEAYSRMAQVQQYLDASTRDSYASGDLDARVEDVLGQIRELSIAGTV